MPEHDRPGRDILEAMPEAVVVLDAESGAILEMNGCARELLGGDAGAAPHGTLIASVVGGGESEISDALRSLQAGVASGLSRVECELERNNGERLWTEIAMRRANLAGGARVVAVIRDISAGKRAEQQNRHPHDVLRAVREIGQLMVHEREPQPLLEEACRILLRTDRYRLVWIGRAEAPSTRVLPVAFAGETGPDYLREAIITCDDEPSGRGPVGTALRRQTISVCPDLANDPSRSPSSEWEAAQAQGYVSVAAVPMGHEAFAYGVLAVYAGHANAFDGEELELLRELAGDLGFALRGMDEARQRARAEAALRDSEARFQQVTQNLGEWVWEVDTSGLYTYSSLAGERLHGYEPGELVGKLHFFDLFPPNEREGLKQLVLTQFKRRLPFIALRTLCQHKDGHVVVRESSGTPIRDSRGQWLGFRGADVDITEREQAEARIREQAALLDHARDAIILADLAGCILYWNRGAERLYGWSLREILGQGLPPRVPEPGTPTESEIGRCLLEHGEWIGESRERGKSGAEVVVQSRRCLVLGEGGQPKSVLIINTDITEQRRLQAQFLRAQRLESISELAGGIAHDLNNLLSPIVVGLPLVQAHLRDRETIAMVEGMIASAQRAARISSQVLAFARGTEGHHVPLNPKHLIAEMTKVIGETFPKNIEAKEDLAAGLWLVPGDATQLHQLLLNLAVNARDALSSGGVITLSARNVSLDARAAGRHPLAHPGDYVALTVADTGTGIAPEILDRVFDPFFTTKGEAGSGMGLSTALGIVKSHGGFITVDTEVGRGAQFHVYLPADRRAASPGSGVPAGATGRGRGELILCVDDEREIRRVVGITLRNHGYQVLTANDGAEATRTYALHRDTIRAVVLDLAMPVKDGKTALAEIRQANPEAVVIVMTGRASPEADDALKGLGAAAVVDKPLGIHEIVPLLHRLLSPKA